MFDRGRSGCPPLAWSALLVAVLTLAYPGDAPAQSVAPAGDDGAVEAEEAAAAPFAIRTMRNGTEIEFFGEFVAGSARAFIDAARQLPRLRVVHLTSNGGSVGEAELLFHYLRKRKLATYVSSSCFSACALAFAGGQERWIGRYGQLSYHSPSGSAEEVDAAKQIIGAAMRWGWSSTGSDFVKRALATPHGDLWLPSTPELVAAGVVSAVSDGSHFALSGFAQSVTPGSLAEAMAAQEPAIAALNEKHPDEAVAIFTSLQSLYDSGGTEAEFIAAFFEHALQIVAKDVPLADDDVIVDMVRVGAEQARSLRAADPGLCASYFRGEDSQDVSARRAGPAHVEAPAARSGARRAGSGNRRRGSETPHPRGCLSPRPRRDPHGAKRPRVLRCASRASRDRARSWRCGCRSVHAGGRPAGRRHRAVR